LTTGSSTIPSPEFGTKNRNRLGQTGNVQKTAGRLATLRRREKFVIGFVLRVQQEISRTRTMGYWTLYFWVDIIISLYKHYDTLGMNYFLKKKNYWFPIAVVFAKRIYINDIPSFNRCHYVKRVQVELETI